MNDPFDVTNEELDSTLNVLDRIASGLDAMLEDASMQHGRERDTLGRGSLVNVIALVKSIKEMKKDDDFDIQVKVLKPVCYNCQKPLNLALTIAPLIAFVEGEPLPFCRKCYPDFVKEDIEDE